MEIKLVRVKQLFILISGTGAFILIVSLMNIDQHVVQVFGRTNYEYFLQNNSEMNRHLVTNGYSCNDRVTGGVIHTPYKDKDKRIITRKKCPVLRTNFHGRENVTMAVKSFKELELLHRDHEGGGRFRPTDCEAYDRIAIIIPYRDRDEHLKIYLNNMIPKLQRQKVDFTFYVIEQAPGSGFNRGMVRNIGFMEARKIANYSCYIFNDVDTILEDDRNTYRCGIKKIRHLMNGCSEFNYRLIYSGWMGGAVALTDKQFSTVNGYSNQFFIWGAEDDNLYRRIRSHKLDIERPVPKYGWYTLLGHKHDKRSVERMNILRAIQKKGDLDGLNTLKYTVLLTEFRKLYTWIYVKVEEDEIKMVYFLEPMMGYYMTEEEARLVAMFGQFFLKRVGGLTPYNVVFQMVPIYCRSYENRISIPLSFTVLYLQIKINPS